MTVLVVGATGSIGRLAVEEAIRQGHEDARPPRNPTTKMANAPPTQNPIAISCRTSGPRSTLRCGLSKLLINGGNPIAKTARDANTVRFLRVPALTSMAKAYRRRVPECGFRAKANGVPG